MVVAQVLASPLPSKGISSDERCVASGSYAGPARIVQSRSRTDFSYLRSLVVSYNRLRFFPDWIMTSRAKLL